MLLRFGPRSGQGDTGRGGREHRRSAAELLRGAWDLFVSGFRALWGGVGVRGKR